MKPIALVALLLVSLNAWSQPAPEGPPAEPLAPAARAQIARELAKQLRERYVFPDRIKDIEPKLQAAAADEADARQLAGKLSATLAEATQDKHLRVDPMPEMPGGAKAEAAEMAESFRYGNYGVARVERLRGNIGYLDLRQFAPARQAGPALTAAMTLLAQSDALIIDLRRNGGGEPETVALLASYLFDKPTHLVDIHWRAGNRVETHWTSAKVPGPRYGQRRPVYVLTERNTFSAAEDFAWGMKFRHRATLVGETTGGGAHPGDIFRLSPELVVFIPTGRSVDPLIGGNWEGKGVEPDHAVPAPEALAVAQRLAIQQLLPTTTHPEKRGALERALAALDAPAKP
ncbi:S41 family peptidase [Mitsuaria sp. 7]|uniref:S41 family peptidase n=1 Tax=Mitsuaria sp. 7 TaxID=1658665 RepID=UPI0009EDD0B9|nr:S41 family peptidase [Mitsuaria sp. 7]